MGPDRSRAARGDGMRGEDGIRTGRQPPMNAQLFEVLTAHGCNQNGGSGGGSDDPQSQWEFGGGTHKIHHSG